MGAAEKKTNLNPHEFHTLTSFFPPYNLHWVLKVLRELVAEDLSVIKMLCASYYTHISLAQVIILLLYSSLG